MLVLFETAAGYALFKLLDNGSLRDPDTIESLFATPGSTAKNLVLKAFSPFQSTAEALAAATAIIDGKLDKSLKNLLKKECGSSDVLAVADAKLGGTIAKKLGLEVLADQSVQELMRVIRQNVSSLLSNLAPNDMQTMALGLSHSLSRYRLKFSPDKVDTMIIQAIALLDDLDKELNTYSMRLKEWYGWHFPELSKIVVDSVAYARLVVLMGVRQNASSSDLSPILPEDLEQAVKRAAEMSMGTDVSQEDVENMRLLAEQIISIAGYRSELFEYLRHRMAAMAPNLTALVGELVGARLIAHAGSLMTLAKHPASTVQILGAEKALFRALKTKHDTPKYGLLYHASLVGQAAPKLKGKVARVLAAKASLAVRVDALAEHAENEVPTATVGLEGRVAVEARLRQMEGKAVKAQRPQKQTPKSHSTPARQWNPAADVSRVQVKEEKEEKKEKKSEEKAKKSEKKEKTEETKEKKEVKEKEEKSDKSEKKEKSDKSEKKEKSDKSEKSKKRHRDEEETPVKSSKKKKSSD